MGNRLFVGNLAFQTTEVDLQDLFAAHGTVLEVKVVTDRDTGRSRGFAFVSMENEAAARKAISELNGTTVDGRELRVDEAQERSPRSGGGGNGRGHGGGRGGQRGGDRW